MLIQQSRGRGVKGRVVPCAERGGAVQVSLSDTPCMGPGPGGRGPGGGGRAGGTAQAIAKKSGRGTQNSTPHRDSKSIPPSGGNASNAIEPKYPKYLTLTFGPG